jgi:hypothetical protein
MHPAGGRMWLTASQASGPADEVAADGRPAIAGIMTLVRPQDEE